MGLFDRLKKEKDNIGDYPLNGLITWETTGFSTFSDRADYLIIYNNRNKKKSYNIPVKDFIQFMIKRFELDNIPLSELQERMVKLKLDSFDEVRALNFVDCFYDNYQSLTGAFHHLTSNYAHDLIEIAYNLDENKAWNIINK